MINAYRRISAMPRCEDRCPEGCGITIRYFHGKGPDGETECARAAAFDLVPYAEKYPGLEAPTK